MKAIGGKHNAARKGTLRQLKAYRTGHVRAFNCKGRLMGQEGNKAIKAVLQFSPSCPLCLV